MFYIFFVSNKVYDKYYLKYKLKTSDLIHFCIYCLFLNQPYKLRVINIRYYVS